MGFCFAPRFHPAMRFAGPVRKELGIPTVFNYLGPLANPGRARYQVIGVSDPAMADKMLGVLAANGAMRAMVVYGDDGLDELSTTGPSTVHELILGDDGRYATSAYRVDPADLGLRPGHHRGPAGRGRRRSTPTPSCGSSADSPRPPGHRRAQRRRRPGGGGKGPRPAQWHHPGRPGHRRRPGRRGAPGADPGVPGGSARTRQRSGSRHGCVWAQAADPTGRRCPGRPGHSSASSGNPTGRQSRARRATRPRRCGPHRRGRPAIGPRWPAPRRAGVWMGLATARSAPSPAWPVRWPVTADPHAPGRAPPRPRPPRPGPPARLPAARSPGGAGPGAGSSRSTSSRRSPASS